MHPHKEAAPHGRRGAILTALSRAARLHLMAAPRANGAGGRP
ncbi:hypothetical protein SCE1572_46855 [Sorangium cellulosum So0157-2]|uniref:Uncharacterized protein n=1 Tax=Sorangium cellulosum So0157-2 TaxID=1254432 RepID=S4Y8Z6_SORCE|nr:hypothetical protein SCE1572_46855 [Sorangium cellulosum So0157-2]